MPLSFFGPCIQDFFYQSVFPSTESLGTGTGNETEEATKVTVRFSQVRDQLLSKSKYAKSYDVLRRKLEGEPWIELNYNLSDLEEFEKLFSGNSESDTLFYIVSRKKYLDTILPKHPNPNFNVKMFTDVEGEMHSLRAQRIPIRQLKRLLLPEQLRHIFINGKSLF